MSKKKERRIKRLQKLPIWPAVLEMIITELVIFVLTIFICVLSIFGIINTLVLNMAKDCNTVIESVNENWNKESRDQIKSRLSAFEDSFSNINEIIIDDKNNFLTYFPSLEFDFDEEAKRQFEAIGMIHFIDSSDDVLDSEVFGHQLGMELRGILFNPRNMYRSLDVKRLLNDRKPFERQKVY